MSLGVSVQPTIEWLIYPNPVYETLNVSVSSGQPAGVDFCIRIFNSAGSLVMERASIFQSMRLDVGSLPNGVYTVRVLAVNSNVVNAVSRFVKN